MSAKRTGAPSARRNIRYLASARRRSTPAAMNRIPRIVPSDSGPPPRANVSTSSSTPIAAMTTDMMRVAVRWTSRGSGTTGERRALRGRGAVRGRPGLDDHPGGPLGEDGLEGLAERRRARPRRQRKDDRLRAHRFGLLHDDPAGLAGADLRPPAAHPAAGLQLGLLDDGLGGKDRKSTRLNSSHANISYAVFCLKKKKVMTEASYRQLHSLAIVM